MKKLYQNLLIGLAAAVILVLIVYLERDKGVEIATDKSTYAAGGALIVNIKNNSGAAVCFSECYPYYMQVMQEDWTSYEYGECLENDTVATCIGKNEVKTFKITLSQVETGRHRIKVPACVGCTAGENFRADKTYYSNAFNIQ